jgi:hypothetical protein
MTRGAWSRDQGTKGRGTGLPHLEIILVIARAAGTRQSPRLVTSGGLYPLAIAKSASTRQSSSFHAERVDADKKGREERDIYPLYTARKSAALSRRMVGAPSPGLRPPSPASGEGNLSEEFVITKAFPFLVMTRAGRFAMMWQFTRFGFPQYKALGKRSMIIDVARRRAADLIFLSCRVLS